MVAVLYCTTPRQIIARTKGTRRVLVDLVENRYADFGVAIRVQSSKPSWEFPIAIISLAWDPFIKKTQIEMLGQLFN